MHSSATAEALPAHHAVAVGDRAGRRPPPRQLRPVRQRPHPHHGAVDARARRPPPPPRPPPWQSRPTPPVASPADLARQPPGPRQLRPARRQSRARPPQASTIAQRARRQHPLHRGARARQEATRDHAPRARRGDEDPAELPLPRAAEARRRRPDQARREGLAPGVLTAPVCERLLLDADRARLPASTGGSRTRSSPVRGGAGRCCSSCRRP